jgi:hypothetical protein
MRSFIRPVQLFVVVVLTACGGRAAEDPVHPDSPAMLEVQNQSFADMVIYAVNGAQRVRLGMATGNSTKSFALPSYLLRTGGPLRFLADPIGGNRTPVSEEMVVHPGELVTLTIPPQ